MSRLQPPTPIIAIVYGDGARIAPTLDRVATHLAAEGCRLAGLVQRDIERAGRSRCDMILEDLATGETVAISQDRGEGARGCRLDAEALLNAVVRTRSALATEPDVVIVNKFGKTECEGGGCRSLIAEAVEHNVPVLVAVPWGNLESWRRFAGDLATEYSLDEMPIEGARLCHQLGLVQRASHLVAPTTSDVSAPQ
jgi:nucleoside-triphosphatase THEP1